MDGGVVVLAVCVLRFIHCVGLVVLLLFLCFLFICLCGVVQVGRVVFLVVCCFFNCSYGVCFFAVSASLVVCVVVC